MMFGEVNPVPCSYCMAVTKPWSCACVSPGMRGSESSAVRQTRRPEGCVRRAAVAEAERVKLMPMGGSSQLSRPWVKAAVRHLLCPGGARGQQRRTGQAVPWGRFGSLTKIPKIV